MFSDRRVATMNVWMGLLFVALGCEVPTASPVTTSPKLMSASDAIAELDLTKLPLMPDAQVGQSRPTHLTMQVPGNVEQLTEFYLKHLAASGFVPGAGPQSKTVTAQYAQVALVGKSGARLSLSVSPLGGDTAHVQIVNHGAYDARQLPKPDDATKSFESPSHAMYDSAQSVEATTNAVAKLLSENGWQEYAPLASQRAQSPEHQQRTFRQRGANLNVSIRVAPAQAGKTVIEYQLTALSHELPAPADAVDLEFDDAKGELICRLPRKPEAAAAEFRELFAKAGLTETPSEKPTDKQVTLRFVAKNEDVTMVVLTSDDGSQTKVRMYTVPAAVLAKLREQEPQATDGE